MHEHLVEVDEVDLDVLKPLEVDVVDNDVVEVHDVFLVEVDEVTVRLDELQLVQMFEVREVADFRAVFQELLHTMLHDDEDEVVITLLHEELVAVELVDVIEQHDELLQHTEVVDDEVVILDVVLVVLLVESDASEYST